MNNLWQKLTITAEKKILEIISADIIQVSNGIIDTNSSHIHFIENKDLEFIKKKLNKYNYFHFKFQFEEQKRENWHLAWKENFTKININNKLNIIPDWDNSEYHQKTIKIKPGMAFGTGHHETTYLILEQLVEKILPNMSVLDLGCGSGILSIAAKKLGAGNVTAVELDTECKENFNENLFLNNFKNEVSTHYMDVLKWDDYNYDIILANINKSIIKKLIVLLSEKPVSKVFLTGLLIDDKSEVISLIEENNFNIECIKSKGEWLLIIIDKSFDYE